MTTHLDTKPGVTRCASAAARRRGIAMILVMVAVAVTAVMALSFVTAQATSSAISSNLSKEAQARLIAETGLALVAAEVNSNTNWRSTHTPGNWINALSIHGGTLTATVTDGIDTNNDGVINGDGSLSDDLTDPITITAKGTYQGVTHSATSAMLFTLTSDQSVAMVVPDSTNLTAQDSARKTQLQTWGYIVNLVDAGASAAVYNAAIAANNVVYVTAPASSASVSTKLNAATCGVVCEQGSLANTMLMSTAAGTATSGTSFSLTNNTHYITSTLTTGTKTIATASQPLWTYGGTLGTGVTTLGTGFITIDRNAMLSSGTAAPGQRIFLPWGGSAMDFTQLNSTALTILQRSIQYAGTPAVVTSYGVNTILGSGTNNVSNKQIATKITVAAPVTFSTLTTYVRSSSSNKKLRVAVYSDSGGNPGSLIVQSASVTLNPKTAHWQTVSIPTTTLAAGTYWLALSFNSSQCYYYKDTSASSQIRIRSNDAVTSGFLSTWGSSTTSTAGRISIYTGSGTTVTPTLPTFEFDASLRWLEQP